MARPSARILGKVAGSLILAAGILLLFTQTQLFSRQAARLLEGILSELTGERALVGGVRVQPYYRRVVVEGIVLSHRDEDPERDGQTILAIDQIVLVAGWQGRRPSLRLLEIDHPVIRLHYDTDGLREFRALTSAPAAEPAGPPADTFPWERLRVLGADLELEGQGIRLSVDDLDLTPDGGAGSRAMSLNAGAISVDLGKLTQTASAVHIAGIEVSPQGLRMPRFDIAFHPNLVRSGPGAPDVAPPLDHPPTSLQVAGSATVSAQGPLAADLEVLADLPGWSAALSAPWQLLGQAQSDVELRGTIVKPEIAGALSLTGFQARELTGAGNLVTYDPGQITAAFQVDGPLVWLKPVRLGPTFGAIDVDGSIDLRTGSLQATLSGEGVRFSDIMRRASGHPDAWIDFGADLEIAVAGTLDPLDLAGSFDLAAAGLRVADGSASDPGNASILAIPRLDLEGELRLHDDGIRIVAHHLHSGASHGAVTAFIGFHGYGPLDVQAEINPLDLSLLRPLDDVGLQGVGRLSARLAGPFDDLRVEGEGEFAGFQVLDIHFADVLVTTIKTDDFVHLELPRFQATAGRSLYTGSLMLAFEDTFWLDTSLLLQRAWLSDIAGMFLDIPGLEGEVDGTLSLLGDPYRLTGEGDLRLSNVDLFGEHFPTGAATGYMDDGVFTLDDLVLTRRDGAESLLARGSVGAGWAMNMEVVSGGLRLERSDLIPDDVSLRGDLSLDARVGGTLFEPEPEGRLAVRDTWLFGERVADSTVRFETTSGVLSFGGNAAGEGLDLRGTLGLWDDQPYRVEATLDQFPVHAIWPEAVDGTPIEALASGRIAVGGTFGGDAPAPVDLSATLDEVSVSYGANHLTNPTAWRYTQHGKSFQAEGIALQGDGTDLSFGGWRSADGRSAFAGGGTLNLDLARAVVPDLQRAEGTAAVQLSVLGMGGAPPEPVVDIQVQDALIAGAWFPHPFEEISASVTARPDGFEILDMRGRLGGGSFVAGGRIDADGWVPTRYDLSAQLTDARVQYLDYLPPVVASGALSFDGPADDLLLSGDLNVSSMVFTDRINWEEWVTELSAQRLTSTASEAYGDYFSFDLALHADDTIRMRNNVADITGSAELRIVGDTSRTGMVGSVRVDPDGRVYIKDREFEVQRAELLFNDPYTYDPDLDIALKADVKGREQEYTIDYRVTGPYSDWTTQASSDPPLSQSDINALLLFGMTQEELERYGGLSTALVMEGGDLLAARLGIVQTLGDGIFQLEFFKLDRVDLVSGVGQRGRGSISSEVRLLAEKDLGWDTTLILEQNLSDTSDTYLALDKMIARQLYARIYWASQQYGRSLSIGGAYGLDFNLRWELD